MCRRTSSASRCGAVRGGAGPGTRRQRDALLCACTDQFAAFSAAPQVKACWRMCSCDQAHWTTCSCPSAFGGAVLASCSCRCASRPDGPMAQLCTAGPQTLPCHLDVPGAALGCCSCLMNMPQAHQCCTSRTHAQPHADPLGTVDGAWRAADHPAVGCGA